MSQLSRTNTVTEYKIILKDSHDNIIYESDNNTIPYIRYEDNIDYAVETAKQMVRGYVNKYDSYCEAEITEIVRPAWE